MDRDGSQRLENPLEEAPRTGSHLDVCPLALVHGTKNTLHNCGKAMVTDLKPSCPNSMNDFVCPIIRELDHEHFDQYDHRISDHKQRRWLWNRISEHENDYASKETDPNISNLAPLVDDDSQLPQHDSSSFIGSPHGTPTSDASCPPYDPITETLPYSTPVGGAFCNTPSNPITSSLPAKPKSSKAGAAGSPNPAQTQQRPLPPPGWLYAGGQYFKPGQPNLRYDEPLGHAIDEHGKWVKY